MAWKDEYYSKYGNQHKINYSPSKAKTWKDNYLERLQKQEDDAAAEEERATQENEKQAEWAETYNDIEEQKQSLYELAQEMQSTAYVSELDRQKRSESGNYQNYYDAEKRSYQYDEKISEILTEAQGIADTLKSYPEDEADASELLQYFADQAAALQSSSDKLSEESTYWKQYESEDAYDEAMRKLDIENGKQEAEAQAEQETRFGKYTESGEAYTPGINLPNLQFARDQAMNKMEKAAAYAADPYLQYTEAEDFEELSKQGAELDNSHGVQNKVTYGRENAFMLEALSSWGLSDEESKSYRYKAMTDDQVKMYNYLLVKEGEESADNYLNTIENSINTELMNENKAAAQEYANDNPVAASLFTIAKSPGTGMGYIVTGAKKLLGEDVDANDIENQTAVYSNTVRGTVANQISEKHGGVAAFLYQTGMSMADSAAGMAMSGGSSWIASTIMGLNAAENAMLDAVERGADDSQALLSGLYAGVFETLFEEVSIDHLFKMKAGTIKDLLTNILKQGVIEGSEEFATDVANLWGDWVVMGGKSQYDQTLAYYMSEDGGGLSFEDAKKQTMLDTAKQIGLDTLGGAISGIAFGGAKTGLNLAQNTLQGNGTQSGTEDETESELSTDPIMLMAEQAAEETIRKEKLQAQQQEAMQNAALNAETYIQPETRQIAQETALPETEANVRSESGKEIAETEDGEAAYLQRAEEYGNRAAAYTNIEQEYSDEAYQKLDTQTKERIDSSFTVMDAMAKRAGLKIRVVDSLDVKAGDTTIRSGANGRYNPETNTVDIALDAQDGAYEYIAAHELTHYIKTKNAAEYDMLAEFVTDALAKNGEDVNALVRDMMERNTQYNEDVARDEVIANSVPAILSDEATVRRLVESNRTLAQKIADFIKQLVADIKAAGEKLATRASWTQMGSLAQDTESLQAIGDLFIAALDDTRVMNENSVTDSVTQQDEELFSKKELPDGKKYVEADRSVLTGDDPKEWRGQIIRYINETIRNGQDVTVYGADGDALTITRDTAGKAAFRNMITDANGNRRLMTDEEFNTKLQAEAHIDELAETSKRGSYIAKDTKNHSFAKDGFNYRTAYFMDGEGNYYRIQMSVGINGEIQTIYNVGKIDKATFPVVDELTSSGSKAKAGKAAVSSIGRLDEKVNIRKSKASEDVRFSIKDVEPDTTADALIKENEQLKKANALLEQQFKLTQGHVISDAALDKLAGKVLRAYQSKYDRTLLNDQLRELFTYLANEENPSWQDVQRAGMAIGNAVIEKSRTMDKETYEYYAPARETLRTTNIVMNEGQREEAAYIEGSYDNYRKRLFGAVKLTNEGTPLDVVWMELNERYSELFPAGITDADMPAYLMDAAEQMKRQYVNPYEMSREEAAYDVFMQAYEAYFDTPEVRTFADKQKEKYDALNREYKAAMRDYRAESKQKYDDKLREIRRENARKRQALSKKIVAEKNEQIKAALRKQYRTLSTKNAEKLAEQKARFTKWKQTDRAREKYSERIEKSAKDLVQWLTKPTDAKHVPEELKNVVRDFVDTLDFAGDKTTIKANEWRARMEQVQKAFDKIERGDFDNLSFFADIDPDFVPRLEEFLSNTDGIKAIYDMDAGQLRELNYLMASMKRSIVYANALHENERFQTVAEASERTMEELNARREAKQLGKTSEMIRELFNADQLDAFAYQDQLGAAGGSMIQELRAGLDKKVRDVKTAEDYARGAIGKTNIKAMSKEQYTFSVTGGKITLTVPQMMELYLLNKREQARGHIYMGGVKVENTNKVIRVKNTDVDAICEKLTAEQRRMADGLQAFLGDEVAGWGNEVSMELYGYKKFTERNYYPIKSDENFVRSQDEQSKGGGFYRLKNLGMTKTTVVRASNPLVLHDIFDTFTAHVDEMSSYHSFVIPISDGMKWFNYKNELGSTKQSIERTLGRAGKQYFTTLIKDVNGFKMDQGGSIGEAMLRNAKIAAVGANLRVVVQQPTAYLRAMNMISPQYLMQGLLKSPSIAKSKQYCPIALWKSYGFYDLNIGRGLKEILTGSASVGDKVRNTALLPASMADEMTWGYLWNACEVEMKVKHPELDVRSNAFNEAVGKRMGEIVDRTQVVDSMFHRSQLMRKKGLMQLYTTFMSEPTKTYNMIRTAAANAARNPQDKAAWTKLIRASATYALTGLFTAAAAALVDVVRDNDEDKDLKAKFNTAFGENAVDVLNPLNMIPVLREIGSILQGYRPSRLDLKGLETLTNAASAWQKYFKGTSTKSIYGLTYQTAMGMSYLTGIPAGNAMRAFEGAYKVLTGKILDKENETATATKSYTKLYEAMLSGNAATVSSLRAKLRGGTGTLTAKNNAEIDAGIAEQLMLNDDRIKQAYEAKKAGNAREVLALKNKVTADGFTGEMFDKAVSRMESLAAEPEEKNMDKELNVKLFSTDDMVTAIERAALTGDESSLDLIYSELLADSTAEDPVKATKSNITQYIKPVYLAYYEKADINTMTAIENILMINYGYDTGDFNDWIKAYNKSKTD